jgi:hypothetical protein
MRKRPEPNLHAHRELGPGQVESEGTTSSEPAGTPRDRAPDSEQDHCADDGDHEAREVEAGDVPEPEGGANEPTKDCSNDTDDDGDQDPAKSATTSVISRHDDLRNSAGNKSEDKPRKNSHEMFPRFEVMVLSYVNPAVSGDYQRIENVSNLYRCFATE